MAAGTELALKDISPSSFSVSFCEAGPQHGSITIIPHHLDLEATMLSPHPVTLKSKLLTWPSMPAPSASAQPYYGLCHFLHRQAPPMQLLPVSMVPRGYLKATMFTVPLPSSSTLSRAGSFSSFGLCSNITSSKKPSLTTLQSLSNSSLENDLVYLFVYNLSPPGECKP